MIKEDKIAIIGQQGIIVSAIARRLRKDSFQNLMMITPGDFDLTEQNVVHNLFQKEKPDFVFLTSVKTGGIVANSSYPADFIYRNLQVQTSVIDAAYRSGVQKMLYLGSSCMYPKDSPQPMKEEYLLSGKLEPTSEPYAIAKIAGSIMCQSYNRQYGTNFICAIPADLYGPEDDFDPETSHVLAALLRKMHEAKMGGQKEVAVWGTGNPKREFLHVDDLADAGIFLMQNYSGPEVINIGFGNDTVIRDLATIIKRVVGFEGELTFDTSKPDGAPRKFLDSSRIFEMGWVPKMGLEKGIENTYRWYLRHYQTA